MKVIKAIVSTVITLIGVAAGTFTLMGVFPEHKTTFLILFGILIGYILGVAASVMEKIHADANEPVDVETHAKRQRIVLTILLLLLPVLLFLLFLIVGSAVGFVESSNRNAVMAWGFVAMLLAYIIGAIAILE